MFCFKGYSVSIREQNPRYRPLRFPYIKVSYTWRSCQPRTRIGEEWDVRRGQVLGPLYTERQCQRCNDASDTAVIENNGVTPEWGSTSNLEELHCVQCEKNH